MFLRMKVLPLDLNRPFLTRQFKRAGRDPAELRSKEFRPLVRGVWIRAHACDRWALLRAALLLHPATAFLSHLTAALLWGLPVPDHPFVHVTVHRHKDRRYRRQIKPHVTGRKRGLAMVDGMRVTDPIATFIDCAGMLSFVDLVILGDAICRKFDLPARRLRQECRRSNAYYHGAAEAAAEFVRDGVDSPMETRLRLLIVLAGLPEPKVNHILRWSDGRWRRRFDLFYEKIGLVVEYDGRQHAVDPGQWITDLERREELDDEEYRLLVVTSKGIYKEPERTLERVRRQLIERGWGDVPPINDAWRAHFDA
jgi:hypothetical protein